MLKLNFKPFRGLSSRHLQTIVPSYLSFGDAPPSIQWFVEIGSGDFLSCEVSTPPAWQSTDKTVVLVHGLGGCSTSPYMVRLARKLYFQGKRVVRVNLRNCGSGQGLSHLPYYGGCSTDILKVIEALKKEMPSSDLFVVGFSLGGSIVLKLAGELGEKAKGLVKTFFAICPPLDLADTVQRISQRKYCLYHHYYLKSIFKNNPWVTPHIRTLYAYDDQVTGPLWGYRGADDYYKHCSSIHYLSSIRSETHILWAEDDPFVKIDLIKKAELPKQLHLWITSHGGHMGFLGKTSKEHSPFWLDQLLIHWIEGDFTSETLIDPA